MLTNLELSQPVVIQHATRGSVNVGPWVLGLSMLSQDTGSDFVGLFHELDGWARQQILSFVAELLECNKPRVGASQDTVSVSIPRFSIGSRATKASEVYRPRNNPSILEGFPEVILNGFVSNLVVSYPFLHLELPSQHFLVGQTA